MDRVYDRMPAPTSDQIATALKAAMRYAAENGVTSVQDMSASPAVLSVYQQLLDHGELSVRVYGAQPITTWKRLAAVGLRASAGTNSEWGSRRDSPMVPSGPLPLFSSRPIWMSPGRPVFPRTT